MRRNFKRIVLSCGFVSVIYEDDEDDTYSSSFPIALKRSSCEYVSVSPPSSCGDVLCAVSFRVPPPGVLCFVSRAWLFVCF